MAPLLTKAKRVFTVLFLAILIPIYTLAQNGEASKSTTIAPVAAKADQEAYNLLKEAHDARQTW